MASPHNPSSSPPPPPSSIQSLVADALREASELASKEIALFRTEMTNNVRSLFVGLAMMVVAAVFAVTAMLVLIGALVKYVATLVGSEWLAALLVGGGLLLVAVVLGIIGARSMSLSNLAPTRTTRQVRQDARALTERVSG
ncbi:MAG TPA: phage holin family protein [Methylobacterium sp.]|jgi:F0F1-type ATP synthase membrane subunit c/vacuolar-type H+-ATPase subunit K|uniref:phage holin family protein n=1 Tax=Methylorubrum sp. B1-46 TaxID=2897334 RepID=UPI001E3C1D16|nr:phage holin family protein [Methylorubrum sp. B1-46]UGB27710.1 phage holin family protein [Methylorubrum sp. B1-46]HEV2542345.1 phage holin family protein [Methylobacterium sp.]